MGYIVFRGPGGSPFLFSPQNDTGRFQLGAGPKSPATPIVEVAGVHGLTNKFAITDGELSAESDYQDGSGLEDSVELSITFNGIMGGTTISHSVGSSLSIVGGIPSINVANGTLLLRAYYAVSYFRWNFKAHTADFGGPLRLTDIIIHAQLLAALGFPAHPKFLDAFNWQDLGNAISPNDHIDGTVLSSWVVLTS